MEGVYKAIFALFWLGSVTDFPCSSRKIKKLKFFEYAIRTINIFIFFSIIAFATYETILTKHKNSVAFLGTVFVGIISLIFRYLLCKNFSKLSYLSRGLCAFVRRTMYSIPQKKFPLKIIVWAITTYLMNVVLPFLITMAINEEKMLLVTNRIAVEFDYTSHLIQHTIKDIFTILSFYTISLPVATFCLFYVTVCFHLCMVLEEQIHFMHSAENPRFNLLLKHFLSARKLIVTADNVLSSLVFFVILIISGNFFFLLKLIFVEDALNGFYFQICVYVSVLNSLMVFFGISLSATAVANKTSKLAEEAKNLLQCPIKTDLTQILFIMNIDKNLAMTVLGGISINKTFVLIYFGTVVSYMMLINSIRTL